MRVVAFKIYPVLDQDQEGAHDEEGDEEGVGHVGTASARLTVVVRVRVTDCGLTKQIAASVNRLQVHV